MEDRCKGVTKSGKPCRNKNGLINSYCKLHVNQAPDPRIDDTDEKPDSVFENAHPAFSDVDDISKGAKTVYIVAAILVFIMIVKLLQKKND